MKLTFSSRLFTRLRFGWRFCAVAFFTFALLGSGRASAQQLTQQQMTQAVVDAFKEYATYSTGEDWTFYTVPITDEENAQYISSFLNYDGTADDLDTSVGRSAWQLYRLIFGSDPRFWNFLRTLSPSNDIADIADSLLHLETLADSDSLVLQSLAAYVAPMQFRSDAHGWELLVGAPDLERLLSVLAVASTNLKSSVDGIDYRLDQGIPVYGSGSQGALQVEGVVNVGNWPEYFTGEYDEAMLEELQSATSHESDWDDVVEDIDDVAYDAADDAESEEYEADVTNSVDGVSLSADEVQGFLPVRDQVFDPVLGLIPRERAFSSDVLILPEISAYGIPRMEYSFGSHPEIESALVRAGEIFGHIWDVFFGVFVCWLIWREYNFYFHTMR